MKEKIDKLLRFAKFVNRTPNFRVIFCTDGSYKIDSKFRNRQVSEYYNKHGLITKITSPCFWETREYQNNYAGDFVYDVVVRNSFGHYSKTTQKIYPSK